MKLIFQICLFFCTFLCLAQPLWEHRALQYNQYSIGKDFFNINQPLQVSSEGELLFSPEENVLYALHNTEVEEYFKGEDVGIFLKKFKLQDKIFFGFSKSIYTGSDYEQLVPQKVGYVNAHYAHFVLIDKRIYFTAIAPSETSFKLMSYDGRYFQELEEHTSYVYALSVNSVPYRCILGKDYTDIRSLAPSGDGQIFPWAFSPIYMRSIGDFYFIKPENDGLYRYSRTLTTKILPANKNDNKNFGRYYLYNNGSELILYDLEKDLEPVSTTTAIRSAYYKAFSEDSQSLYLGSNNQLTRLFTYLKTYPRLYNDTNTDRIFALALTPSGKLWAGSYNGGFSVIDNDKLLESPLKGIQMSYGALPLGEKVLFNNAHKGLYLFQSPTSYTKVSDTIVSNFNFLSSQKVLYTDVQDYGLAYKPMIQLEQKEIPWKTIGKKQGLTLNHCQGIAQDSKGYIWTISMQGVARYNPKMDTAQTLLFDKEQTPFRGYTLLADANNTLWFGSEKGQLYYYNPTDKEQVDMTDFHLLEHPLLLGNDRPVVFLHQWRDYLIIGITNKLFVLSLNEFVKGKVNVRYLNPYAMNLQDPLERTCVASNSNDDHLWFASSNMLFRWDIDQWLSLSNYKVEPTLSINTGKNIYKSRVDDPISLEVNENSFEIRLHYQTKDNLPRYVIPALYRDSQEDAIEQGVLTTETEYRYQNLSAGDYIFSLTVCQNDGTYTVLKYPISVKRSLWQNSYFWLVMILIPAFTGLYLLYNMRRMDRQDREIALLTISNLGKQFRPHFMLNALNSLGAELYDNPHAERIISHIGENISIMHRYSQDQTPFIPFSQEWKLTENTIAIQREIFLPDLQVQIENIKAIPSDYRMPMGILQVIVENSLLHGLRHRDEPPQLLRIAFWERANMYGISISDNGVGVAASKKYAGVQRHGTGLKNIQRILRILDKHFDDAITISMTDKDKNDPKYPGTITIIELKKSINYEKINL